MLSLLFGLIYVIAVLIYYGEFIYQMHDPATGLFVLSILFIILIVIVAVRLSWRRENHRQLASDMATVAPETTARVQRLAHGLLAVTERALGERWLQSNPVPEGHTVISRQVSLESLRRQGAWSEMPLEARDWLARPDKTWPDQRIALVLQSAETLNTLLWALGLTRELRPNENLLAPLSLKRLVAQLEKPAVGIRPIWDLRAERNAARLYFIRCYSERVHRGELKPDDEEQHLNVRKWMTEIRERPHEDFLAGAQTIAELDQGRLYQAARSSAGRLQTLDLLMRLEDGENVWDELTRAVYISLLLPSDESHQSQSQPVN